MTSEQIAKHNRLFDDAIHLIEGEIIIQGHAFSCTVTADVQIKFERALNYLMQVVALNSINWSAMWLIGKIYQRLDKHAIALAWFVRAYKVNSQQADIPREASISAMAIGNADEGIMYANNALGLQPLNSGLRANLAMALLLAGRVKEAQLTIADIKAGEEPNRITEKLKYIINHFIRTGSTPPTTISALEKYHDNEGRLI